MSRRRPEELVADKADLTPMIDVVFNLLVFFMCATKLRSVEGTITAYLPKDLGLLGAAQEVRLNDVRVKLLWHDAQGRPTDAPEGHVVVALGPHRFNAPGDLDGPRAPLHAAWRDLHARLVEIRSATEVPDLPVIIDAHPQVPTQHVVSALNEAIRAGLKDVRFAAPATPMD